jgi:hypothetical protein
LERLALNIAAKKSKAIVLEKILDTAVDTWHTIEKPVV